MTHADLIARAVRWLRNSAGCQVVLTRPTVCCAELPDAIGWAGSGRSILVECKVSRSDFFRDLEKPFRKFWDQGMGNARYYLTPPGLVRPDEIPAGWGLLHCLPAHLRRVTDSKPQPTKNCGEEIRFLLAHMRREPAGPAPEFVLDAGCLPDVGL